MRGDPRQGWTCAGVNPGELDLQVPVIEALIRQIEIGVQTFDRDFVDVKIGMLQFVELALLPQPAGGEIVRRTVNHGKQQCEAHAHGVAGHLPVHDLELRTCFVHAPVFMTPAMARDAKGMILLSGARDHWERLRPVLEPMTGEVWYVGAWVGEAAAYKLFGNAMILVVSAGSARGERRNPLDGQPAVRHKIEMRKLRFESRAVSRRHFRQQRRVVVRQRERRHRHPMFRRLQRLGDRRKLLERHEPGRIAGSIHGHGRQRRR